MNLTEATILALQGKLTEEAVGNYYNKFENIYDKYLPDEDEGDTMASQIVTAVNKLIYRYFNDGDVYDNSNLGVYGEDMSSYANWLYKYVPETKEILDKIYNLSYNDVKDYEYILKDLATSTLYEEFLQKYDKPKQGTIYDCDGPYFCNELEEDDDYEEEEEYSE